MSIDKKCPTCGGVLTAGVPTDLGPAELEQATVGSEDPTVRQSIQPSGRVADATEIAGLDSGKPGTPASVTRPQLFGDYELLETIAHGGMGIVYKARQISLNRIVAVKMILGDRLSRESDVKRFLIEAQAAAKLQHLGIVAIHEVGKFHGQHFYSMDYVAGQSLAQVVREHPLPAKKAAGYVQKIALAIHFAHTQGVLHRDLKPGNILIAPNDEPRVTDFGLAKLLNTDSEQTLAGTVMGTPSYMSPEQASGQIDQLDARSDVYSLGAILYELLTGTPPFRGETTVATLKLLLETEPVPPRQVNPKIPADLETVCLKALEKEPAKRYADAAVLSEDLRRFLHHEPIAARPIGVGGKIWRWCKRKPALATVGTVALLLLLTVAIGSPIAAYNLGQSLTVARRNAYVADMSSVQEAIDRGQMAYALQLLRLHLPKAGEPDIRNWEWRYFWQLCQGDDLAALTHHDREIYFCDVSQTGQWVSSEDASGVVKLWNIPESLEVLTVSTENAPGPAFSPTDAFLAVPTASGAVRLWALDGLKELTPIQHPGALQSVGFNREGNQLITFASGRIRYWDLSSRTQVREVQALSGKLVVHSEDWKTLAVADDSHNIMLWREDGGVKWKRKSGHDDSGSRELKMALSPDGTWVAVALAMASGWTVQILDAKTGEVIIGLPMQSDSTTIMSVGFSRDAKLLATASNDQTIRLWDTKTWSPRTLLKGQLVSLISFLPDGKELVTGGEDGYVRLWKVEGGKQSTGRLELDPAYCTELSSSRRSAIAPDNSSFFIVSPQGETVLVDPFQAKITAKSQLPFTDTRRVAAGPKSSLVVLGREKGLVTIWDTGEARVVADFKLSKEQNVEAVAFSPNGKWVAARGEKGASSFWDMTTRKELQPWRDHLDQPLTLLFSPNSQIFACGHRDGRITLWDVASHRQLGILAGHKNGILRMGYSSDGKRLATTSYDATGRVWDIEKFVLLATFTGSKDVYFRPEFSPDGKRLFLDEWGHASLFDIESQRCVARLETGFPKFLNADVVLGVGKNEIWHWKPASLADIEAAERSPGSRK